MRRLEEQQVITRYTILVYRSKLAPQITAYINMFMKSGNSHHSFLEFVRNKAETQVMLSYLWRPLLLMVITVADQEAIDLK